jgi:hypothetical protein
VEVQDLQVVQVLVECQEHQVHQEQVEVQDLQVVQGLVEYLDLQVHLVLEEVLLGHR